MNWKKFQPNSEDKTERINNQKVWTEFIDCTAGCDRYFVIPIMLIQFSLNTFFLLLYYIYDDDKYVVDL